MWKKILIALFTMIGTFSVIFAFNRDLFANKGTFSVGGEAYGQLGAPAMGDRIYLGTQSNLRTDLGWVILADYSTPDPSTGFVGNNAWFAMATSPLDMTTYYNDVNKIPIFFPQYLSSNTAVYESLESFNLRLTWNPKDLAVVAERNIEWFNSMFSHAGVQQLLNDPDYGEAKLMALGKWSKDWTYGVGGDFYSFDNWARAGVTPQFHFWKTSEDYGIVDNGTGGYVGKKVVYPYSGIQEGYDADGYCDAAKSYYCPWTTDPATQPKIVPVPKPQAMGFVVNNKNIASWMGFHLYGGWADPDSLVENRAVLVVGGDLPHKISFGTFDNPNTGTTDAAGSPINAVRPAINFNKSVLDKVVFSLAKSSSTNGVVKVKPAVKTFGVYNSNEDMKIRIESNATKATFNDIMLNDESIYTKQKISKSETAKVANNKTIKLQVNANAGNDNYGVYVISAIITDDSGNFIAYAPLDYAKDGVYNYELDLSAFSMLENGKKYKLQVVNESYSDLNVTPADCSPLSTAYAIELYEPLDQLTASTKSGLVYGTDAVRGGAAVGSISTINGYGTPIYKVIEDPSYPGQANEFEMGSVNANHQANILIKGQTTNYLKAGTYHFLVQATDANGDPDPALTVPVSITVKPQASTVAFMQTGTQEMKIGGSAFSGTISYSNNDSDFTPKLEFDAAAKGLLTVTLSSDKRTYTVAPASTYTGTELPKTFTLTLSGNATTNYSAPKSVTKTFTLYKDLSGLTWYAWEKTYPIDTVANADIAVGTLVAVDGYPNFTYSIESSTDNMFKLAKTTGTANEKIHVKTTGKLSAKTYTIQFKVVDQKGVSKTVTGTITVSLNDQDNLYFVNTSGTDITSSGQSVAYGDKTQKLKAMGGSSSKEVTYALAPDADQPTGVGSNAADYVTIGSDGSITPKKVGTVKVMATRPADDTYSATTAKMNLTITAGGQSITWPNVNDTSYHVFDQGKTFTVPSAVLTRDDTTKGAISYSTSTSGVCTISGTTVTMKTTGTCVITASNKDTNYKEASKTVNIVLYDGITGNFTSVKVNQGSDEAKGGSTKSLVAITLSGGDGTYSKTAFTVTKDSVDMTSSFTLSGSDNLWRITPAKDLKYGSYNVSATFTDGHGGSKVITGTLTIGLQTNANFKLVDGPGGTIDNDLISKPYAKDLSFKVSTTGSLGSGAIKYKLSDDSTKADPAISIDETTGTIKAARATTDNETYKVYAYIGEDTANGYAAQTTQQVTIKITSGGQSIAFQNVPTHKAFKENGTFTIPEAVLTRDDKTTGTITYGTSTPAICTISGTTVTMKAKGKCTITAKNEDDNYQTANATANIELYTGISGTLTPVKVNQGSDQAKADSTTSIANITLTGGDGTYNKTAFKVMKDNVDMTASFSLSGSKESWNITPAKDLKYGTYDVSITYEDGHNGTGVITGTITVGLQTNSSFKLVDEIGSDIPNNVLTKEYEKDFKFYVKTKGKLGNGIVHYHMSDDSTTSDPAVTINEISGQVSVSRLLKDGEVYKVYATIEEDQANGYAKQTTQEVIIKITEGTQSISFDPSTQDKVQFEENGLFEIKAILTRKDGSSGDITYESITPTICEITSSDKVKMLDAGTCTIKAFNKDENYQKAENSKSIVLYNQATGSFKQVNTPQAEVNAKLDTALGTFKGEHGKGTLTYENSTDSSVKNQGASLINVEPDGTIKLKQDVSAADLASLATYKDGFYQVNFQVVIKDDGQEASTVDCVANIKGAPLADVRFKDEVNGIITKTFGDTFVLALLNNPGGTPTYSRKDDSTLPTDVIDEKIEGSIVKILHANDPDNANLPIIIANIPAANGYDAKEISAKVSINKAKQDGFKFRDENMNMKTESMITPLFEGAKSSEGITVTSGDETILTIVDGDLKTAKKTGTVTVTAIANEDRDYESKTITKDIIVYDNLSATFTQRTPYPQANTDSAKAGTVVGQLSVDGGQGTITREVITGNEFITLPNASSNFVKLNKDITAEDLKGKWNDKVKAYIIKTEIKFIDTLNDTVVGEFTLPVDIYFRGAPLPDISFADDDGNPTKLIQKPYVLNGDFLLTLTGNTGEGTVKYHLKDDDTMPNDVLAAVDEDGTAYIDNANDKEVNADDVIVQADIEPNNGYEGTTVECVVEIMKAKQDFDFKPKDQDIEMKVNDTKAVEFTSTPKGGTVKLELKDPTDSTKLSISGTAITAQETGTVIIKATAPGGRNYEDAIREKNVIIYDDMNVTFTQDHIPQAETDTAVSGVPVGTIELSGGIGEVSAVIDETTLDGSYFKIDGDSIIINKDITVDSIKDKWNEEEKAYIMNVTVKLTDSKGNTTEVTVPIKIKGAPLTDVAFKGKDGKPTYRIVKTYSKAPFKLELVDNSGGGAVTYSLKQDEGLGVIKIISENGSVTIDNANEKDKDGKAWAVAEIGAKNGYDSATIEAEIYIEQAPQPNFKFREKEVTLDYHGTMDTMLQNKLSSGEVTYSSNATGIASVDENGTITAYTTTGDAIITAICKEDRNYLSATATMIVHVVESEAYPLVIEVPSMTYGDAPVQAEIKQQGAKGENLTQTWTSSDESIASIDEQGNITAHHAGTVTITLSQTSDGEPDVSTSVTLTVKPKPIELTIDNKEKLVGEEVPKFTIQPIEGLVGNDGDTFKVPDLSCKDQKNNPVTALTPEGTYAIKATILPSENPDYTITKINEGTLVIKEDKSAAAWYRLESEATRTSSGWYNKKVDVYIEEISTPYDQIGNSINGPWSDHFTVSKEGINETDIYFRDSTTKAIASKQVAEIKIDMHEPMVTSIAGSKTNTEPLAKVINALTLDHFYQVGTEIEIVAEDPKPTGVNTISDIERIEYKIYRIIDKQKESEPFKEGTAHASPARISINEVGIYDVCATVYDHAGNKGATCQEIEMVEKEEPEEPEKPKECLKTDIKWSITNSDGKTIWYTMNEDTNNDGIPDLNIDSDGDGKPDINVDSDDDGKPDVNLLIITKDNWKPKKCVIQHDITYESYVDLKPIINVDLDIKSLEDYHDAIPDINIDTGGDMKADFNIDINNDGKPDINIGTVHTPWKPNQDYTYQGFVYDTSTECESYLNIDSDGDGRPDINIDINNDGKPDLNIDVSGNGIPDTNIDTTGDGKPNVNIDTNHDGVPDENVYSFTEWKPEKDGLYDGFAFDTMEITGKGELEDNGIVVEKPGGSFLPNFAIKVEDVTSSKKEEVVKEALDQLEETQEIKAVYDVKLLENDVEVQPDGTLKVRIPIPEGISNPKLMIKKSDGTYEIISAKEENGYLVYETNELGIVSIIGDKEDISDNPKQTTDPEPTKPNPETADPKQENPKPAVQGDYTGTGIGKNMGGALSGDSTNIMLYIGMISISLTALYFSKHKKERE